MFIYTYIYMNLCMMPALWPHTVFSSFLCCGLLGGACHRRVCAWTRPQNSRSHSCDLVASMNESLDYVAVTSVPTVRADCSLGWQVLAQKRCVCGWDSGATAAGRQEETWAAQKQHGHTHHMLLLWQFVAMMPTPFMELYVAPRLASEFGKTWWDPKLVINHA